MTETDYTIDDQIVEAQVERMARAMYEEATGRTPGPWAWSHEGDRYRRLARAALAVMAPVVAEMLALAEKLEADSERAYQRSCGHGDDFSDGQFRAYEGAAERLRERLSAALAGETTP